MPALAFNLRLAAVFPLSSVSVFKSSQLASQSDQTVEDAK